jgi:hypothetical protein
MTVPAGWYTDGADPRRLRWFDGKAWTSHVTAASAVPPPPPGSPPVSAPQVEVRPVVAEPGSLQAEVARLIQERDDLKKEVVETRDLMLLQEVGLYRYSHPLDSSVAYKDALEALEDEMGAAVKQGSAVQGTKKWAINGSEKEGARMVADFCKLMLRAYNTEADNVVRTLRPHTLEAALGRLDKMRRAIAKLGATMKIEITDAYHALRVKEITLTADYLAKVAEEKEREREERQRLKDEEIARREYEREQEKLEKERTHYETAVQALRERGDAVAAAAAEAKIEEINSAIEGVVQRAANVRAGYVYIISNLGSFGERVVKIGMTRRLDPMDRIRELGDASVPFRFDVHAVIFSDDAVGLETSLHQRFAELRVNLVNIRREFFYTTPHAVRDALVALRGDLLSFAADPEALEWHQSETTRRGRKPTVDEEGSGSSASPRTAKQPAEI